MNRRHDMDRSTWRRAGMLMTALSCVPGPAAAQVDLQGSTFTGAALFLIDPPDEFRIRNARGATPVTVTNGTYENDVVAGATLGVRLANRFGIEGTLVWVPTELSASSGLEDQGGQEDADILYWGGRFLYHFPHARRVSPYVGVGVGGQTISYKIEEWERETTFSGSVMAGLELALTGDLAVRAETRDFIGRYRSNIPSVGANANTLLLTVGLSYWSGLSGM
jgi:opacity protein-like surface antigen